MSYYERVATREFKQKVHMKINLKYWRMRRAMTIRDLVEKSKVSSQTIVNIEKYARMPQPAVIKKLAAALDVQIEELVQENDLSMTEVSSPKNSGQESLNPLAA
jgi:transcriptional regulator with XRE-family HTH domain